MQRLKCLFIEDSQTDIEIMEWELKKKGVLLEYIVAETLNELNLALLHNDFDIIISDHNMPCLDSVTARIKSQVLAPNTPFVVLSFYIPIDVLNCLKINGVHAIIEKYDVEALYQLVSRIIAK
jgi:CheY-like chemotaxis protein